MTDFRFRWGFNPWDELRRLQHEMEQAFESSFGRPETPEPPCNIWEGEDDVLVTCEAPGIELDGMDISVMGDALTLRHEKAGEQIPQESCHRRERPSRSFERSLRLPARIDPEKVEADYSRGVLKLTLGKAAEEKPRKIEVKVAD